MTKKTIWTPAAVKPDVARGESARFWVACRYQRFNTLSRTREFLPEYGRVIEMSFINAELTEKERRHFEQRQAIPYGSPDSLIGWVNEDGDHLDSQCWAAFMSHDSGFRVAVEVDEGWLEIPGGDGRFKVEAWSAIEAPLYPTRPAVTE